jgi:hypothetical protein
MGTVIPGVGGGSESLEISCSNEAATNNNGIFVPRGNLLQTRIYEEITGDVPPLQRSVTKTVPSGTINKSMMDILFDGTMKSTVEFDSDCIIYNPCFFRGSNKEETGMTHGLPLFYYFGNSNSAYMFDLTAKYYLNGSYVKEGKLSDSQNVSGYENLSLKLTDTITFTHQTSTYNYSDSGFSNKDNFFTQRGNNPTGNSYGMPVPCKIPAGTKIEVEISGYFGVARYNQSPYNITMGFCGYIIGICGDLVINC